MNAAHQAEPVKTRALTPESKVKKLLLTPCCPAGETASRPGIEIGQLFD
jgi:hypothetical protein